MDPQSSKPPPHRRTHDWAWALAILAFAAVSVVLVSRLPSGQVRSVQIPYSPTFVNEIGADNVKSISSTGSTLEGEFRAAVHYPTATAKAAEQFKTEIPTYVDHRALSVQLRQHGVVLTAHPPGKSTFASLLLSFLPALLIVGALVFLMRRAGGGGGLGGFGRSHARRIEASTQRVTFDDVAGIDEAQAELAEIVDFLRHPDKYRRMGGRIPRGVLLTGPPGTGKTLLARALAGEAEVPFFSISASEFVELYVGVGASRVRDLFAEAKQTAPAIIFIDELDAIGRSRAGVMAGSGGHDEREQTLNQILTEMDGFDASIGVIVLSATNRPEVLDKALLRPGRFDRRVALQPPDTVGRRRILDVHTRSVPLDDDVDLDRLAATTAGMVGADLANVVNEAALLAARREHEAVGMDDFDDALEKLVLGTERRILLSPRERRRTAYHEAGHAIVGMLAPGADPVRKVSIIPHGVALGVTLSAPEADRFSYDRAYLLTKIKVMLGGRVAEEIVFGDMTTGAQNDIREATEIARDMVGVWGMSDTIGPVAVLAEDPQARLLPGSAEVSEATAELVDVEVRRIIDDAHEAVTRLLADHRRQLDALAHALLERETLDEREAHRAANIPLGETGASDPTNPSTATP